MILAILEHSGTKLPKAALSVLAACHALKSTEKEDRLVALLLGSDGVAEAAAEAAQFGADEVVFVESPLLARRLPQLTTATLLQVCKEYAPRFVVAATSSMGKDVFPRIAFALDAGQASDVSAFLGEGVFQRLMYAGNIVAEVEVVSEVKLLTIRVSAFEPAVRLGSACAVKKLPIAVEPTSSEAFVSEETVQSERPELAEAEIVVSGGRALKSAENFEKYIAPLADVLGGAIGASRAAVDSGYAPNDWQVGQTGKVVAPKLYIAVGISGAIQHLAGMKDSKTIVAINTDPEAPIFEIADYGLVADLFQAVPELVEKLQKLKK